MLHVATDLKLVVTGWDCASLQKDSGVIVGEESEFYSAPRERIVQVYSEYIQDYLSMPSHITP
jgi:hypothetical protein